MEKQMGNEVQTQAPKRFSVVIQGDAYKKLINNTLGDPKKSQRFVAAISSAVATNPLLQECEPGSILSAGLLGEALNLSPSPQLGQYYMVPYNNKKTGTKIAQFQLGYKGYIQLAVRSGYYKKITVLDIKEGELIKYDPLNEEIEVSLMDNELARESAKTTGYFAMFEYHNGFRKAMYWSKTKMESHADKFSTAFDLAIFKKLEAGEQVKDAWKYSSFWYKNFDDMAFKTLLRQLISKWGIMSIELQTAFEKDMGEVQLDSGVNYIDSDHAPTATTALPMLSDEDFSAKKTDWQFAIETKLQAKDDVIAMAQSKYTLSDEQLAVINSYEPKE
jgi:recombination protein RecT